MKGYSKEMVKGSSRLKSKETVQGKVRAKVERIDGKDKFEV